MQSIKQLCAVAAVEMPFAEAPNVVRALGHILCASRWGEDCSCSEGQLQGEGCCCNRSKESLLSHLSGTDLGTLIISGES